MMAGYISHKEASPIARALAEGLRRAGHNVRYEGFHAGEVHLSGLWSLSFMTMRSAAIETALKYKGKVVYVDKYVAIPTRVDGKLASVRTAVATPWGHSDVKIMDVASPRMGVDILATEIARVKDRLTTAHADGVFCVMPNGHEL